MKKVRKTTLKNTEIIDEKTGELLQSKTTKISYEKEPDYVKLYLEDVNKILNLKGRANETLLALIRKMNYDNEVVLTPDMKKELAASLNVKLNTFEHNITILIQNNIFIKKGVNFYLVNPNIIAKGDWQTIKTIRMTVTYDKNGRMFQRTYFNNQESLDFDVE